MGHVPPCPSLLPLSFREHRSDHGCCPLTPPSLQHTASPGRRLMRGSVPCLMLPGTWAVDLPWPRDTPDSRDVLKACLERQQPPQYRAKAQTGDFLEAAQGSQLCDWQLVQRSSQRKALLPAHASILSHTHWHRYSRTSALKGPDNETDTGRSKRLFSPLPNVKNLENTKHIHNLHVS